MKLIKEISMIVMYLSISCLMFVGCYSILNFSNRANHVYKQQELVLEAVSQYGHIITELGYMFAAVGLEEEGILAKTAAEKIIVNSIDNLGEQSDRLKTLVTAINNNRR
ncbi:MAG: hypothetical protein ACR2OT_04770 [Parvibaculales bacterium]